MIKYIVFYKKTKIGMLEINEKGQHRYTPNKEGVEVAIKEVSLTHDMLEKSDWREPIPFFKNRLDNAKRFSMMDEICSQTDDFKMKLI